MDSIFGIHADALLLLEKRAQVLATNLVNSDTPNYKAKDLDFNKMLANKIKSHAMNQSMSTTKAGEMQMDAPEETNILVERQALQPSADGNTVDEQREESLYTQNAMQYLASLNFISNKAKMLTLAMKGE